MNTDTQMLNIKQCLCLWEVQKCKELFIFLKDCHSDYRDVSGEVFSESLSLRLQALMTLVETGALFFTSGYLTF